MESKFLLGVLLLSIAGLVPAGSSATETNDLDVERVNIEAAVRDYIDGWYDGDADRMARGLHPDLRKRSFRDLPGGGQVVNDLTYTTMIAYTEKAFGAKSKKEGQINLVEILDVSPTIASAKSVSPEFIDYLHLAKVDGKWRIVNVLWELTPEARAAKKK